MLVSPSTAGLNQDGTSNNSVQHTARRMNGHRLQHLEGVDYIHFSVDFAQIDTETLYEYKTTFIHPQLGSTIYHIRKVQYEICHHNQ